MTILKYAQVYRSRYGWRLIPIPHKSEHPVQQGWQGLRLTEEDLPRYFSGQAQNIGVLLGEPSDYLVDVVLNCEEARRLAPLFLPETLTLGRKSAPQSHRLYVLKWRGTLVDPWPPEEPPTTEYQLHRTDEEGKRTSEMLVELRSTGALTIVPPSVHPSGERIEWTDKRKPEIIEGDELVERVKLLAVACLFLRHWPRTTGTRQNGARALAGALIRSRLSEADAERFIYAVALCAGDEGADARAKAAAQAAKRNADGKRFWGWPKVAELFGEDVAAQAQDWLDRDDHRAGKRTSKREAAEPGEAPALPQHAYDRLPKILREAVSFFDAWHKRDVFLTALLGVLSSALPKVRFLYGQIDHSTHLNFFVIARAASGKGVMPHAFHWLDPLDGFLQGEWLEERKAWQQRKEAYEKAKRSKEEPTPDPPGPEPPERCLKAGANTTTAALAERLAANPLGVFIGSTEADTLTSSNRREHGDFSYVIRQSFHHEEAQVDRKTDVTLRIERPCLALVLSGTPKQFPRFMERGVEDGLYSRFGVYSFEAPTVFEAQWATAKDHELAAFTEQAGRRVRELYKLLRGREEPLYFAVPEHLRPRVEAAFKALHDDLAAGCAYDLLPTVRRGMVITLRIAAVLSVWRQFEEGASLDTAKNIVATEADVEAAVALGLVYVEHALREALRMAPKIGTMPDTADVGGAGRMTGSQRRFYDALPEAFRTNEAEDLAESMDVPRSTLYDWLSRFTDAGLLVKPGRGRYEKARHEAGPSGDGESRVGLLDFVGLSAESARNADSALDFPLDFDEAPLDYGPSKSNSPAEVQSGVQSENGLGDAEKGESPKVQESPRRAPLHVGQRVETARGPGTVEEIPGGRQKVKVRVDALVDTPMPVRAFDATDLRTT